MPPAKTRGKRPPLSRERVVAAGVELADAEGAEALSMRKLAQSLGVEAMSLYHHVANKDELLDGMVDVVFAEVHLPVAEGPWQVEVRARCASLREVLLRHPWAVGLLNSRRNPGMATLVHHDAVIGCLLAGGFDIRGAAQVFAMIDAYVYGFVVQELSLPMENGEDEGDLADAILGGLPEGALPHLVAMATAYVTREDYRFANEFAPGLDLMLDTLERQRPKR
ncbi:MAG TPA: TetR/AcrR family transcriptional regulator C-terminal domain-containing protein [Acidimicrobiales bacterium]|nr:TetR/AcrR family transcriptional regulator C-terminal domain-containing protein [Acidimicrobiales bacterium]